MHFDHVILIRSCTVCVDSLCIRPSVNTFKKYCNSFCNTWLKKYCNIAFCNTLEFKKVLKYCNTSILFKQLFWIKNNNLKIVMIGRIILKLMETAVMDIDRNILRNFRRFFQNGDKIHSQLFFFCKKYCNSFLEKKYCNNSILQFLKSIAILLQYSKKVLQYCIAILQYCITEGLIPWHFAYLQNAYQTFCLADKMPTDIVPIKHLKDPVKYEFSGGKFSLNRPWRAGNVQFGVGQIRFF